MIGVLVNFISFAFRSPLDIHAMHKSIIITSDMYIDTDTNTDNNNSK